MKNKLLSLFLLFSVLFVIPEGCRSREATLVSDKQQIQNTLNKVIDWQIRHFSYSMNGDPYYLHDYGIDSWTNATFYIGLTEWAAVSDNGDKYYSWLDTIGNTNDWKIPASFKDSRYSLYHADELCIGQFYIAMYNKSKQPQILASTQERVDWIMNNPPDESMAARVKQSWTWCDALFMAPPVYAGLYKITGNKDYLKFMDLLYQRTYDCLYDKDARLFYRDDNYFEKTEANGQKVFWGRGNGWAAAGLVNLLKILPPDSGYYPFYQKMYVELVSNLSSMQDKDGFWHASLLDPESYPSPETSATALITYALAYGVNNGLLEMDKYAPVINKAWGALNSAIDADGKLGWVQPIGADPKTVTQEMTSVYGVGALLLAGTEVYKIKD